MNTNRCEQCGQWFDDPWMSKFCPDCEDYNDMQKEEADRPCRCGKESNRVCISCWERFCEECVDEDYICGGCSKMPAAATTPTPTPRTN